MKNDTIRYNILLSLLSGCCYNRVSRNSGDGRLTGYFISEEQINNIIEVLNEWKVVLESFIENFILLKQTKVMEE